MRLSLAKEQIGTIETSLACEFQHSFMAAVDWDAEAMERLRWANMLLDIQEKDATSALCPQYHEDGALLQDHCYYWAPREAKKRMVQRQKKCDAALMAVVRGEEALFEDEQPADG